MPSAISLKRASTIAEIRNLPSQQVRQGLMAALVGHVGHIDTRRAVE
jgi:hypothetical protein